MAQGAVKLLVTGEATLSNDDLPLLFILILLSSPLVCFYASPSLWVLV